jgi:hypothetical protein
MDQFLENFMGGMEPVIFFVYLVWAYIGMIINLIAELSKRKPESKSSPKKLSGSYYFNDNWKRVLIAMFLIPVSILVFGGLFGMEITNDRALMLGLGADMLAEIYKRKRLPSPKVD